MGTAYIVKARRTAGGRRGGALREWHPADLAAAVLDDLVQGIDPTVVEDVIMGCVNQFAQQSTNIARNAILASSLPESVPGTSVDRQCGSSQQAMQFAATAVMSGIQDVVIAAGVESMTRVPMAMPFQAAKDIGAGNYMSPNIRARYPDVHSFSQFVGAEMVAKKYGLSKDRVDEFGFLSQQLAAKATKANAFANEIVPLKGLDKEGNEVDHLIDEGIRFDATLEATKGVKLLSEDGVLTAATSSQICDGASGVLIANEAGLKKLGLEPIARLDHMSVAASDPVIMLETPIPATEIALKKAGRKISDIDLYEVNEAFASVPLAWLDVLGADPARLNVNGGAIALGHPLGASGTKLMATLIHALRARGQKWGLQTMCEGGGLANVTLVEAL